MKAIIPVAGIGTRLQPLTNKVPKVLINVAGKSMLFHLIDELINNEKIDTIILVIGYLGEKVKEAVNKHYLSSLPLPAPSLRQAGLTPSMRGNNKIRFEYVQQKEMLGLGHAVYHGKGIVGDEPLLIVLGDTIFEFDLEKVLSSEYSAIGVKEVDDITRWGIVESKNGYVNRMIEKPSPDMTNSKSAIAGVYYVKSGEKLFKAVEYLMENNIRTKNEYQLTDALQKLVNDGEKMVTFDLKWFDCGKPETLLSANAYLLKRDHSSNNKNEIPNLSSNVSIGDSKIISPVYIGENCVIENSVIGPYTTIAGKVTVKNSSITNSLICEDSQVIDAELDEVIIGNGEKISYYRKRIVKGDNTIAAF